MCVMGKPFVEIQNLLMNIHFIFDTIDELNKLVLLRLSSIQKDKTNLSVSAFFNKVLNRVSSVKKLTVRSGH